MKILELIRFPIVLTLVCFIIASFFTLRTEDGLQPKKMHTRKKMRGKKGIRGIIARTMLCLQARCQT